MEEVGADNRALRRDHNRIPKKNWIFDFLFEIFGFLVSPATFNYLVSGNPKCCFPVNTDIPLDLGTHSVITFIEKFCFVFFFIHIHIRKLIISFI